MRVLLLFDALKSAEALRDLNLLKSQLDPNRLQLEFCTLRGAAPHFPDGTHSLEARGALDPLAYRRLTKLLRTRDIELVHSLEPATAFYAAISGRLAGIPTLANCYNIELLREVNRLQWRRQQLRWRILRVGIDRVIVPAEIVRRHLWYAVSFPRTQVEIVYPGVDFNEKRPLLDRESMGLPQGPLATLIAPDGEDTGYEVILDALPRLRQRVPSVHLAIFGVGPTVNHLQRKASQIRPALPLRWLGNKFNLRDVIAASDVILAHPTREGVPYSLVETAAVGKPVVAARVGGIAEIVDPMVTGLLVTPGDISDLAIQTSRFLLQPGFARRVGLAAQRRARERFSLEAQRDAMTILYETTIYASR